MRCLRVRVCKDIKSAALMDVALTCAANVWPLVVGIPACVFHDGASSMFLKTRGKHKHVSASKPRLYVLLQW